MYIERGQTVRLVPTDPWDMVTATGSGPFPGIVTHIDSPLYETVIIRLDKPFSYKDIEAYFVVASTRHVGKKLECIGTGIICNLMSLTEEEGRAGVFRPDLSAEERLAFIGDVLWVPTDIAHRAAIR